MAFDQNTRNRLARFVSDARSLLTEEFTRQLQHEYGLDPAAGEVTPLERLTALDDARRETARILRETLDYYLTSSTGVRAALDRILREQAFTVLNRLCALRMAEARGLILEAVAQGYRSKGFQLYARLAGSALGETGEAYRSYLFSLFDELALELPPLFDRFSPQGRLFPRQSALLKLFELLNHPDLEALWAEDETIGWIYQYFNSKEERQAMRAESQAPRNSRELAVRNQFFTPRYVVEFLTDNTLGRIWYEMTQGETGLKESCRYLVRRPVEIFLAKGEEAPEQDTGRGRAPIDAEKDQSPDSIRVSPRSSASEQEDLLNQPVYIPHRPLKDPREILMLDPACGSMHFGLYAFDLYEVIYAEAWEIEEQGGMDRFVRSPGLRPLYETYPNRETFLRAVPRLIIEHNIHGIDIDPRAVQIAGLSLWLRAQKSWQDLGLKPGERPQIRKSNIVCAEPMPGDRGMLEEFLAELGEARLEDLIRQAKPDERNLRATKAMAEALKKLARTVWQEMEFAGEAGSLLKIEETLRDAVATARKASDEKAPLFRMLEYGMQQTDVLGKASGSDFWSQAEALTLVALRSYAEGAANGQSYRRRLFAGDAVQGFAFIDLCQKRYDAVLMNPPFGQPAAKSLRYIKSNYQDEWKDIYAAFFSRALGLCTQSGFVGAITSLLYLYSKQLRSLRTKLIEHQKILYIIELGGAVLDAAAVEIALTILSLSRIPITGFLDLTRSKTREDDLLHYVQTEGFDFRKLSEFTKIINWPLCYHLDRPKLALWEHPERLETELADVVAGNHTFDDYRFLRSTTEIQPTTISTKWYHYEKGGEFHPFIAPPHLVINWANQGAEARAYQLGNYGTDAQTIQSVSKWYKAGITYPRVSSVGFGPKALPANCIFSEKGMSIFPYSDDDRLALLGLLVSSWIEDLLNAFGRHRAYENTAVANLPIGKEVINKISNRIEEQVQIAFKALFLFEYRDETSPYFVRLSDEFASDPSKIIAENEIILACNTIDLIVEEALFENSLRLVSESKSSLFQRNAIRQKTGKEEVSDKLSYLFGCTIARWDIRFSTGQKLLPDLPDPFASLPKCPPGMLQNAQGLPASLQDMPTDYPLRITWGGVLVDDPGHPEDITGRVREALQVIWNERAEAIEQEACQILGVPSLREYFRKPGLFFAEHLKRYSKSRRQAPIYWPLSTPSASYTLWLYYHRLSDQTLFTCVNDFIDPKLAQVAGDIARLRQKKSRSAADEKELERLVDFEAEMKDFRAELLRVAAFWKPDLNDGVQITAAPLWKLFQHRPWQRKLKETWEKLEKGEYDWAHLAYSIWPERVKEKCKTDKSLAIAHGLEEVYVEVKKPVKKKGGRKKNEEARMEGFFDED